LVKAKILNQIDFNTTVRLQNHILIKYDGFLSSLSLIGSVEVLSILLFIIAVFQKKIRSFFIFAPFIGAHLVEIIGKGFFHHPGPPFMFFRYNLGFLFPSSYINTGSSYPSGHSLRIIFVSIIIAYLIKKSKLQLINKLIFYSLILLFDGFMLVSRISLGEHWTSDVVAGALLGMSSGIFALIFL
jgi:undecaprenyl-diphosphatase